MGRSPGVHRQNRRGSQCGKLLTSKSSRIFPWSFKRIPWVSRIFPWSLVNVPWVSMFFHEFPCLPRIFHNFPWFVACLLNLFWDSFKTCQDWSCGFVRKHGNGVNMFRPIFGQTRSGWEVWARTIGGVWTFLQWGIMIAHGKPINQLVEWHGNMFYFYLLISDDLQSLPFFLGQLGAVEAAGEGCPAGACNCIRVLGLIYV